MITFNGQKIIAPKPGMGDEEFDQFIQLMTNDDLAQFGNGNPVYGNGAALDVSMLKAEFFRTDAHLITVGQGVYRVVIPGQGYVLSDQGGPFEIDMGSFIDRDAFDDLGDGP